VISKIETILGFSFQGLAAFGYCLLLLSVKNSAYGQSLLSPPIPMKSAVMLPRDSAVLMAHAVYSQLKAKIKERYDCDNFTIDKIEKTGGDSDLAVDADGRLWQGTIAELWTLNVCGSQKNLGIVVIPDGKGGIWLAVGK